MGAILACLVLIVTLAAAPFQGAGAAEEKEPPLAALTYGPASIAIRDEATLALPQDFAFIPQKQADEILRKMGNFPGDGLVGIILPKDRTVSRWFIVAEYDDAGYISDAESTKIDADELLQKFKENAADMDDDRRRMKLPELEVLGWIEPPHYDGASHNLIWSLEVQELKDGKPIRSETEVNYNTRVLGRGGFVSLNLVAPRNEVESDKPVIRQLLGDLKFDTGKRYEDYNAKTDKTAEYGLIALIGGIAAHKLGFFALAAAFGAKFIKIIVLAGLAGMASIRKFFRRGKNDVLPPPSPPPAA